ncbi:hypothetical protein BC938DRAFT_483036 [Jimgerdemannia flammicorona]|uniref:Uncharacterized protein n=1 Tax=Jimgerdemannia flammicorona TaxID=994334 RepID=A0A433QCS2_9FUNG|nr:hypothetical protein BC938DRAFT_483036 [Jimgerdemannia flammicorona]
MYQQCQLYEGHVAYGHLFVRGKGEFWIFVSGQFGLNNGVLCISLRSYNVKLLLILVYAPSSSNGKCLGSFNVLQSATSCQPASSSDSEVLATTYLSRSSTSNFKNASILLVNQLWNKRRGGAFIDETLRGTYFGRFR